MSNTTKLMGIAPLFIVPDVVATAEYYRDRLGFTINGYFLDPPVYAMVERDGIQIHFGKADGSGMNLNAPFRRISFDAYIWVTDLDRMFEELTKKQVEITEGIVRRVYGSREFVVRDCNGFSLVFGD